VAATGSSEGSDDGDGEVEAGAAGLDAVDVPVLEGLQAAATRSSPATNATRGLPAGNRMGAEPINGRFRRRAGIRQRGEVSRAPDAARERMTRPNRPAAKELS
jgi:hypothetical protein